LTVRSQTHDVDNVMYLTSDHSFLDVRD